MSSDPDTLLRLFPSEAIQKNVRVMLARKKLTRSRMNGLSGSDDNDNTGWKISR